MDYRLLALPLLLGLSACSVGDAYQRPETPTPAQWSHDSAASGWPATQWWKGFRSAELDSQMQRAEEANFDLAAAVARIREADALARVAGAPLLPSLGADAGATRSQTPALRSTSGKNPKAVVGTTYNAGLNASYEIDFWGKNAAARDSALASARANRYDRQTVALTVQAGVATTFFNIVGLQDRLAVARDNLANAEDVLAAINDRLRGGTATDLDVAQQEAEVDIVRAALPPLEQQLAQDINALGLLTGRLPEEVAVQPNALAKITLPTVSAGLPSELLARRPDVRFAEEQLVGANADITTARAAFFPSVQLTTSYGVESLALSSLLKPGSVLWSLGSSVTQPLFKGGALEGELDYRKARYDELVATYRKSVVSAFTDVENALVAVAKSGQEQQAQQRAEASSRRAYQIALDQLKGGIVDITTVLNTQKTLFQAEDSLVQAKLAYLQAVVGLAQALGGGWDGAI